MKESKKIIYLIPLLVLLLVSLNFFQGFTYYQYQFRWIDKHEVKMRPYNPENNKHNEFLNELIQFRNVTVIAKYDNNNSLGFYDVPGFIGDHSSTDLIIGIDRYFSFSDYLHHENVKIKVNKNVQQASGLGCSQKDYEAGYIACVSDLIVAQYSGIENPDLYNLLAKKDNIREVLLYANPYNHAAQEELKQIIRLFENHGYEQVPLPYFSVIDGISLAVNNQYAVLVLGVVLLMVVLGSMVIIFEDARYEKKLRVLMLYGLSYQKLWLKNILPFFISLVVITSAVSFVSYHVMVYLRTLNLVHLNFVEIMGAFILWFTLLHIGMMSYLYNKGRRALQ